VWSGLAEIVRDLLILLGAMTALLVVLVLVLWRMRDANPIKRVLKLLAYRVGATVLAGAAAVPIEPIPIADAIYDFGIPIVLIWYWFTFFRDLRRGAYPPSPPRSLPQSTRHGD
jgi:hypothetical protein